MSPGADVEGTLFDASCIQTESKFQPSAQPKTASESSEPSDPESLIKIPWTITNKYYSAPVHFAVRRIHGLGSHQLQNVPAIVFVWSEGEPSKAYKYHIERITQDLDGYEPEVCLAVRLARQGSSRPQSPVSEEEDDAESDGDVDGFLTSRGFEFIDAVEKHATSGSDDSWTEIPGMERVLDALSTIMWPSMQPTTKGTTKPQTRERVLLDWASTSLDVSSLAVEDAPIAGEQTSNRAMAMKQEMQELARWLEEDVDASRDDPWRTATSTATISLSPTAMEPGGLPERTDSETFGFDDNFTVFVSAPAPDDLDASGRSTPDIPPNEQSLSVAPHAGSLYRSLGSVSDFGGSEDGRTDEDGAEDLPSKEEILSTSSRIFGASKHLPTPGSKAYERSLSIPDEDLDTSGNHEGDADGDASYDMEAFDLSKVLTTLQEMKAEIASIGDEGERRKAAARVALGLVYGLEADAAEL
ncbi:hypothetical protein H0H92_015341 [Tricholoma furcatifolium]|nr:hypothetical protein H0H92_015341 [Tricholoma furcatifolium]